MGVRRLLLLAFVCVGCSLDSEGTADDNSLVDDTGAIVNADVNVEIDTAVAIDTSVEPDTFVEEDTGTLDSTLVDSAMPDTADTALPDTADTALPDTRDSALPDTADTSVADAKVWPCVEGSNVKYNGHCYFPVSTLRTWAASRDRCAELGAHLVTIASSGEQAAVGPIYGGERWIGATRVTAGWFWFNGDPGTYSNWDSGEPNGSGNCARMMDWGGWRDESCTATYAAICERDYL